MPGIDKGKGFHDLRKEMTPQQKAEFEAAKKRWSEKNAARKRRDPRDPMAQAHIGGKLAPQHSSILIPVNSLVEAKEGTTSDLEKRCIADVLAKAAKGPDGKPVKGQRDRVSRAYAICRSSLQKSGRIKDGTAELTKKGEKISGAKSKKKDNKSKVSAWKSAIVAARKRSK